MPKRTPRIFQRVSTLPAGVGSDEPRAIAAAGAQRRDALDVQEQWQDIVVPIEIRGVVHKVKVRGIDMGVAT